MSEQRTKQRDICLDLFRFDYLAASHLTYYFQTVSQDYRLREVNRYLAAMEKLRLIRRFPRPAIRSRRGGSSPKVVALGEVGAHLVAEEMGIYLSKAKWKPSSREVHSLFLDHTLKVAEYAFALRYAAHEKSVELQWVGESELKRSTHISVTIPITTPEGQEPQATEKTLRLIPDGLYTISTNDESRRSHYLLEMDMGTVTINKHSPLQLQGITQKIAGYHEFLTTGLYKTLFAMERPPRITWITTTQKRLENLKAAVENTIDGNGQHSHWFTTLELATSRKVLSEPVWSVAGETGQYVLFKT